MAKTSTLKLLQRAVGKSNGGDHQAALAERRVPEKLGSHVIPVPIRQLLCFTWPGIKGGFQFGYADAPTRSELAHVPDPKRPWVIWARGSGVELVLLALDDRTPANPEVHVVRATPKRVFRSKKRLDLWLAALR